MKLKEVRYGVTRQTKQFENNRLEVVIEVEEGETSVQAMAAAKRFVERNILTNAKDYIDKEDLSLG